MVRRQNPSLCSGDGASLSLSQRCFAKKKIENADQSSQHRFLGFSIPFDAVIIIIFIPGFFEYKNAILWEICLDPYLKSFILYPKGPVLVILFTLGLVFKLSRRNKDGCVSAGKLKPMSFPAKMLEHSVKGIKLHTSEDNGCVEHEREPKFSVYGRWQLILRWLWLDLNSEMVALFLSLRVSLSVLNLRMQF